MELMDCQRKALHSTGECSDLSKQKILKRKNWLTCGMRFGKKTRTTMLKGSNKPREQRCGKRWTKSKRPWRTCLETGMSCIRTSKNIWAGVGMCRTGAKYCGV